MGENQERWIAEQPWLAAPGGWVVPEPFQGWRFRLPDYYRAVPKPDAGGPQDQK